MIDKPKKKRNRPDHDGKDRTKMETYRKQAQMMGAPCHICGLPINYDLKPPNPWSFTMDHIIPISKGGPTTQENLAAAHRKCNRAKGDKLRISPEVVMKLRMEQGVKMDVKITTEEGQDPIISPRTYNEPGTYPGLPQSQNWRVY